jgi:ubiquinone/menaquinone biosynthesis C-methylase UbiE
MAFWRAFECYCYSKEKIEGPTLDVGCGDGFFAQIVFEKPLEAGIDLDPLEVSKAEKSRSYHKVVHGSATEMPFPNRSFKTVISNCVLEHIPDIDAALGEIHRVLKPKGRLLITVPSECFNEDSFFKGLLRKIGLPVLGEKYLENLNSIFKHHHVDSSAVWKKRLKKAGFKMEKADYSIPVQAYHTYERWLIPAFPAKIFKILFGRWVIGPRGPIKAFAARWMKKTFQIQGDRGAVYFIVAQKG